MVRNKSWSILAVGAVATSALVAFPATVQAGASHTPTTRLVTVAGDARPAGGSEPAISATGRYVTFTSLQPLVEGDTNDRPDVYRRDLRTRRTQWVSLGSRWLPEGGGSQAAVSGDGRVVAYLATSIVPGEAGDRPGTDLMVRDLRAGVTRRVAADLGVGGMVDVDLGPAISANGRYVAFVSLAAGVVPDVPGSGARVYRHDLRTGRTELVPRTPAGAPAAGMSRQPTLSGDGRLVAFASDTHDLVPGDTRSAIDVFVRDMRTGATRRLIAGAPSAEVVSRPVISAAGRSVAVTRWDDTAPGGLSANLVVYDLRSGSYRRVVVRPDGSSATAEPGIVPSLSAHGRFVAFASTAPDLVSGDSNGESDVFVRDMSSTRVERVSVGTGGQQANGRSSRLAMSGDARFVAFESDAANLTRDVADAGLPDIFARGPLRRH